MILACLICSNIEIFSLFCCFLYGQIARSCSFCKVQIVTLTSFHCSGLRIARHGMTLASGCFLNHLTVKVSCRCGMCWEKSMWLPRLVLSIRRCSTRWFLQVQLTKWSISSRLSLLVVGIDGVSWGYKHQAFSDSPRQRLQVIAYAWSSNFQVLPHLAL